MMKNQSVEEIHIHNLSLKREEYLKVREESWEEEAGHYSQEENPEIDSLGDEILKYIKLWKYALPFEFIIEELTKLGWAPCLLYDDGGHFAITGEGMQNIPGEEKSDMQLEHWVKKEEWHDTIRQALNYYLDHE